MSIHSSDPWFDRGQTLGVAGDATLGTHIVGTRKVFQDKDPATGLLNSNELVECVAVRNISGGAITPGQVVKFASANLIGEVDANADVDSVRIGVVDEYLPAAGCADDDICWVVVGGPVEAVSDGAISQAAFVSIGTSGTAGKIVAKVANKTVGYALAAASGNLVRIFLTGRLSAP